MAVIVGTKVLGASGCHGSYGGLGARLLEVGTFQSVGPFSTSEVLLNWDSPVFVLVTHCLL